jgi:hypothetical protein
VVPIGLITASLDGQLASLLPDRLLGIEFEKLGVDPRSSLRNYDEEIGAAVVGHFDRPLDDLKIGLARPRDASQREGVLDFEVLVLRLPESAFAQIIGAYLAEAISRPGVAVGMTGYGDSVLSTTPSYSIIAWTDEIMYVLAFDAQRAQEMATASPPEWPMVNIDDLARAALEHLGVREAAPEPNPALRTSPAPAPRASDLEAALPQAVDGHAMTVYGSWASLAGGVDYFTLPAALIAQQAGRPLADAAAAVAAPADNSGHVVTAVRFPGMSGDEMLVDFLAQWFHAHGPGSGIMAGTRVDEQRVLYTDVWAAMAHGNTFYWIAAAPFAGSGPDMADYAPAVARSLP